MAQLFAGAAPALATEAQVQVQIQANPANPVADLTTQVVVNGRHGEVLRQGHMVKLDAYPGLHTATLQSGQHPQPQIEGAPNFREVPNSQVFGMAQPTVSGLREALQKMGAGPGSQGPRVNWTSLREEPVVYIQGRSFTVRDLKAPFANLEDTGISSATVEQRENTLKQEILQEAQRYGGRFLVAEESADGSLVGKWVELKAGDVQTPSEVYTQIQAEGYRVDYARIPISDERAPENQDFDALVERLRQADPKSPLVFNCHAGRGRTTTGMVIGQLFRGSQSKTAPVGGDRYEQGNFRAVLDLLHNLRSGQESKAALDSVIDEAGSVQNLRTAIARLKQKSETLPPGRLAEESLSRGKDYLYRYYKLIAFESYLREMAPQGYPQTFSQWIQQHPELDISPESLELAFNQAVSASQLA